MIATDLITAGVKLLFVFILTTAAFIITRRNLNSLVVSYSFQSLFISLIALLLYVDNQSIVLLSICLLTLVSKVIIIPVFMNRVQKHMKISRDIDFHYLSPNSALMVSIFLIMIIYGMFFKFFIELSSSSLFFFGAVVGISLTFMGLLVIFSRKKAFTNIIGYLTMENGVLLFSLFFPELPFIIEFLIMLDLIMIILLSALLAFGIDSSIEEFHHRLNSLGHWFNGGEEE